MRIFLFLTFTVLVFVTFFVFKESINKKENDVLLEKEISNEIEEKILDFKSSKYFWLGDSKGSFKIIASLRINSKKKK